MIRPYVVVSKRMYVKASIIDHTIDESVLEFQDWINENLGYYTDYYTGCAPDSHGYNVYFQFFFDNDEDAAAFKLRWEGEN